MRILQVTPGYYPELGGVERHVQAIAEALAERGHQVVVATASRDAHLPRREVVAGVTICRFHALGRYPYLFPVGMFSYLREQAPAFDIVHAHNYHALSLLVAALACPRSLVISPHYHGLGSTAVRDALHRIYDPPALAALRRVAGIICVSPAEADLVARRFGVARNQIAVAPNIVLAPDAASDVLVGGTPRADGQRRLILSVGRLEAYKRVDRLIAALPYLPADYALAVIGTGPERINLAQIAAQLGIQDRVRFLGYVGEHDLRMWYERADLAVTLSSGEAFGRVVVEALAAGRHVVCSDIPAFRDFAAEFPQAVTLALGTLAARDLAALIESAMHRPAMPISLRRYTRQTILTNLELAYGTAATGTAGLYHSASLQEPTTHENSARV